MFYIFKTYSLESIELLSIIYHNIRGSLKFDFNTKERANISQFLYQRKGTVF